MRGDIGMLKSEVDEIPCAKPGETCNQPCESFGVHKKIPIFKEIYEAGHGLFISNMGLLHKSVTESDYHFRTESISKLSYRSETNTTHLFSLKAMKRSVDLADPFGEDPFSTGVIGRMLDVLEEKGHSVSATSIDLKSSMMEGNPLTGRSVGVVSSIGVHKLTRETFTDGQSENDLSAIEESMKFLNEESSIDSGFFADFWSQNFIDTLNKTEHLGSLLESASLLHAESFSGVFGLRLKMIAKLIIQRKARSVSRDGFYLSADCSFDAHSMVKESLSDALWSVNLGLSAFYAEMVAHNLLSKVTVAVLSESGRTLSPNSGLGSDHGWGGNYFMFGGDVKGGKILGKYPSSFEDSDATNLGRGRIKPTTSWDAMWFGIAQWYGITSTAELNHVLPNNGNFGCGLLSQKNLFTDSSETVSGCNDKHVGMNIEMSIKNPQYLSGIQEKQINKAVIGILSHEANITSRVTVLDQQVHVFFDNGESRVLSEISNLGYLQGKMATFKLVCRMAFNYDDNEEEKGTLVVEDSALMSKRMNEYLAPDMQLGALGGNILSFNSFTSASDAPSSSPSL